MELDPSSNKGPAHEVSSQEPRLRAGGGLLAGPPRGPSQVGKSPALGEPAGHHRSFCWGASPHPPRIPFSGQGPSTDKKVVTRILAAAVPQEGEVSHMLGVVALDVVGNSRRLASLVQTSRAWLEARALGIFSHMVFFLRGQPGHSPASCWPG